VGVQAFMKQLVMMIESKWIAAKRIPVSTTQQRKEISNCIV